MAPRPATPRSKPKEAASRAAAEPFVEDPSGADAAPSALDAIPKHSSPMTPTQRLSWQFMKSRCVGSTVRPWLLDYHPPTASRSGFTLF